MTEGVEDFDHPREKVNDESQMKKNEVALRVW
jgi:hypothetical protein